MAACVLGSACADTGATPLETVASAVARTLEAGSARAAFTVTAIGPDGGQEVVVIRGEGTFHLANRLGSMRLHVPDFRVPALGGDLDAIVLGSVQILQVPPDVPLGRPWLVVDHRALHDVPVDPLVFDALLAADPSTALRYLRGVGGEVRRAGTEVVRGVPAARFETVIDLRRAAEQAPADLELSLGRLISRFRRARVPAQVWIDDDGRVRRIVIRLESSETDPTFVLDEVLYDFGARVTVTRPAAEEMATLPELLALPPPRRRR